MATGSELSRKGKLNFLKRMYGTTVSVVEQCMIGSGTTTALDTDFRCETPISLESKTTIDLCDAITGWTNGTDTDAPTLDTSEKIEGTASINMGKSGTSGTTMTYTKTISSIDLSDSDKRLDLWVYIKDTTTRSKIDNIKLYLSDDGFTSYYGWNVGEGNNLNLLWNLFEVDINGISPDVSSGTINLAAITDIRIEVNVTAASDTIILGDMKMDYWHQGKYWRDKTNIVTGNPTFDSTNLRSTLRFDIAPGEATGEIISEAVDANTERVPEIEGHDIFTGITKTSKDSLIIQFVNEAI